MEAVDPEKRGSAFGIAWSCTLPDGPSKVATRPENSAGELLYLEEASEQGGASGRHASWELVSLAMLVPI